MTPKYQSQKNAYDKLETRLQEYSDATETLMINIVNDLSTGLSTIEIGDSVFRFTDHTELNDTVDKVRNAFVLSIYSLIADGIDKEWANAQKSIKSLIKNASIVYDEVFDDKYTANTIDAFRKRTAGGLTISQRIWRRYYDFRDFLETSISASIQQEMNVSQIRTALVKDLQDINGLRLRYKDMFGTMPQIKDVKYHIPRLVASEINMAYRESEQQGWRQLDFVLGLKINLSGSHKLKDICDDLAGVYPKSFKWYGWHPLDKCYMTPVLMPDTDFWDWNNGGIKRGEVKDVPQNFKQWVDDNVEKINSAKSPYFFIADNWDGRLKDYARYKTDSNYKDVAFDYVSGGLKASHKGHIFNETVEKGSHFGLTPAQIERECQNNLLRIGDKAILRNERCMTSKGYSKQLDLELNDVIMDIHSVEGNSPYYWALLKKDYQIAGFNAISEVKSNSVCFYFHDTSLFSRDKMRIAIASYIKKSIEKGFTMQIRKIICVLNDSDKKITFYIN